MARIDSRFPMCGGGCAAAPSPMLVCSASTAPFARWFSGGKAIRDGFFAVVGRFLRNWSPFVLSGKPLERAAQGHELLGLGHDPHIAPRDLALNLPLPRRPRCCRRFTTPLRHRGSQTDGVEIFCLMGSSTNRFSSSSRTPTLLILIWLYAWIGGCCRTCCSVTEVNSPSLILREISCGFALLRSAICTPIRRERG